MIPQLKLLVDPVYTASRLSRCPVYWAMERFADAFSEAFPDSEVLFCLPDANSPYEVDIPLRGSWQYVYLSYGLCRYHESFFPSEAHRKLFSEYDGLHGDWDVVLTARANGAYFRHLISDTSQTVKLLCFRESFPQFVFKKTACSGNKSAGVPITMRSVASYLDFDHVYMQCDYEREEVLKEARNCLSPSMLKALDRKMSVVVPSFPQRLLSYRHTEDFPKPFETQEGPLKVFYIQRLGKTQRRFALSHEALSKLFVLSQEGEVTIQVCTNSAKDLPKEVRADAGFFVLERPPREVFHQRLKEAHVVVSFSKEEGLPMGLTEALLLGCIGVFVKEGWSQGLCGPSYPYYVTSPTEAVAVIRWISRNRKEAFQAFCQWMDTWFLPKMLTEHPDMSKFAEDVRRHFEEQTRLCRGYVSPLGKRILESPHVGKTVDVLYLPYPGFSQRQDLRLQDVRQTSFFKLPRRWVAHYWLRAVAGFRRTGKPWVLANPKFCNAT